MALELKGKHKVALGREQVWALLNDPQVLQAIIPGCESLNKVSEDKYELGLNLLVGSVSGNYKGSVELTDKQPPEHYNLALVGEGTIGFVKGGARFALAEEGGATTINYDGTAEVGGLVAGVGNRVLSGVAKFMAGRFFKALDKYIKEHAEQGAKVD